MITQSDQADVIERQLMNTDMIPTPHIQHESRRTIQDIPNELLEELFHKALVDAGCQRRHARHRLLGILLETCHTWANVAQSSPRLWSVLPQVSPCGRGSASDMLPVIERYLQRSAAQPLTFEVGYLHVPNSWGTDQDSQDRSGSSSCAIGVPKMVRRSVEC